jgi:hypothetical protein
MDIDIMVFCILKQCRDLQRKDQKLELPGELSQEGTERFGNGLKLLLFFMVS